MSLSRPDLIPRFHQCHGSRYRVGERLGEGAAGTVFAARDLSLNREVAIKILHPRLAGHVEAERFVREVNAAGRLSHPNLLPVLDTGSVDAVPFLVTRRIEGGNLRTLLEEGPVALSEALAIAEDMLSALSHAHASGMVHRDVKPENILIDGGRAIVADFGIALALDATQSERLTSEEAAVGTPRYMSPEQSTGGAVDERSDLYSAACVIWEMLAGEHPFGAKSPHAVLARKVAGEIPGLRVVRPRIPERVEQVLRRALDPAPDERWPTADAFLDALLAAANERPSSGPWIRLIAAVTLAAGALGISLVGLPSLTPHSIWADRVVVARFHDRTGGVAPPDLDAMIAYAVTQGLRQVGVGGVVPTETGLQMSDAVFNPSDGSDSGDPILEMALALGAGVIVSGEYYSVGDSLQIHVQVSEFTTRFERFPAFGGRVRLRSALGPIQTPVSNPLQGVEETRSRVMGALAVAGAGEEGIVGSEPILPAFEAFDPFSEGLRLYATNDFASAAEQFLEAWRLDQQFVPALLYAALNRWNLRDYAATDSLLAMVEEQRDRLSSYHRGWLDYRRALLSADRVRALQAIRELAEREPASRAPYNYGIEAWENGYAEEARSALEGIDPRRGPMRGFNAYWGALASIQHQLGDYGAALETAREARDLFPELLRPFTLQLGALAALGRIDELRGHVGVVLAQPTDRSGRTPADVLAEVAEELEVHGNDEAAREVRRRASEWLATFGEPVGPSTQISLLLGLGQVSEARALADSLVAADGADVYHLGYAGLVAAAQEDTARAREMTNALRRLDDRYLFGRHRQFEAMIAAMGGDPATAATLLRQGFSLGLERGYWMHRSPYLESVRNAAGLRAVLEPLETTGR